MEDGTFKNLWEYIYDVSNIEKLERLVVLAILFSSSVEVILVSLRQILRKICQGQDIVSFLIFFKYVQDNIRCNEQFKTLWKYICSTLYEKLGRLVVLTVFLVILMSKILIWYRQILGKSVKIGHCFSPPLFQFLQRFKCARDNFRYDRQEFQILGMFVKVNGIRLFPF